MVHHMQCTVLVSCVDHMFTVEAMVRDHYEKQNGLGCMHLLVKLSCKREVGNIHDTFVVTIKKDGKVVGHSPRKMLLIGDVVAKSFCTQFSIRVRYKGMLMSSL